MSSEEAVCPNPAALIVSPLASPIDSCRFCATHGERFRADPSYHVATIRQEESMNSSRLFVLNIAMAIVVVVLLLSGNIGPALIAIFAFALVALKAGRSGKPT